MTSLPNPMQEKITEWLNAIALRNQPHTVKQYNFHLARLKATAPDRAPHEWTTAHLLAFLTVRREAGNGNSVLKQIICAFRSFFAYAVGEAHSPAVALKYPKIHRRKQRTLDAEAALNVLASLDTSTPYGARDLAIITLMLDTGLRASEVCRLQLAKVNLETRHLRVIVKGGDEEEAYFSRATAGNMARWLSARADHARPKIETFFISLGGTKAGSPLTRAGLQSLFRHLGRKAGLEAFSPHDLRRTFATLALREGASTRIVQAAGRWGDVSMVELYTSDITAADIDRYSPVEALLRGRKD